ncbi:MAG: hypothetical protein JWL69_3980 [Phycisphaerales bacterium]|jgi:hypothetical protein|nr:hypothetical protein [Phycisphaerales bacterium]MDB5356606.1 hypothetical protein [Phycisphaerales bacterium]
MLLTEKPRTAPHARPRAGVHEAPKPFPAQVELILSAIEAGQHSRRERRTVSRIPYRAQAKLQLFSDHPNSPAWTLYTRDVNRRGLGFISPHRLPLGYGGLIELRTPDGRVQSIHCTLVRCREAAPGWFEGSLHFSREQPDFAL